MIHSKFPTPKYPDWSGKTCFILGGGPSLKDFDPTPLRERGHVIGVNEAGLTLVPWCDILYWADRRWFDWNEKRIDLHTGPMRFTSSQVVAREVDRCQFIHWMPRERNGHVDEWIWFRFEPNLIGGFDGGGRAINLAYHCGATRVVLLGFDMHDYPMDQWRDGNWHDAHQAPPLEDQRANKFIPAHEGMAKALYTAQLLQDAREFEVLNATPGSALTCWPKVDLEDLL